MAIGIMQSVGKGGVNLPADVGVVRQLLAGFAKTAGNLPPAAGPMDQRTIDAIIQFQTREMKLVRPDGRVDPGGKTIAALLKGAKPAGPITVTYGAGVPAAARLVSSYAIEVIKKALDRAGMSAGVITSTLRLPDEQAATMYKNALKGLQAQFRLYGATGDEVLKVFEANKKEPEATVIALMTKTIEKQLASGKQVSRHVTTAAGYARLNVIDIGVNSTKAAAGQTFDLNKLTKAFGKLQSEGYIKTFIDETGKSNTCWHLEIVPNAKPL
jgi:peptidoglycan hydrolase-like protein with peptidoglycan-binding domain